MDRFAFIHGSSEGQSSFVPSGVPKEFTDVIEKVYFEGREFRKQQSGTEKTLIVELVKNHSNEYCCAYTYVNNNCIGAQGRRGQYFAVTIFSKKYVYPEPVYNLLFMAYSQLLNTKAVLQKNNNNEDQYVISQFREKDTILNDFLLKIEDAFMRKESTYGIDIKGICANYDNWAGHKVVPGNCNSLDVFSKLCEVGRIYISDEYESSTEKVKKLESQVSQLQEQLNAKEEKLNLQKTSEQAKTNEKIRSLNAEINQLHSAMTLLKSENEKYSSTIDEVRKEISKVENKSIGVRETAKDLKKNERKDILTISLLVLNLILVVLSSCLNYCFFRNNPSSTKEKQEEVTDGGSISELNVVNLIISSSSLPFTYAAHDTTIVVTSTGGQWELPEQGVEWAKLSKLDDSHLNIHVLPNSEANSRFYVFKIKCKDKEKTIEIVQDGKPADRPIEYQIGITDSKGNTLSKNSTVTKGEVVTAIVLNPGPNDKYGWAFDGCSGDRKNVKENKITITGDKQIAIIAYGLVGQNNSSKRTKIRLKVAVDQGNQASAAADVPDTPNPEDPQ